LLFNSDYAGSRVGDINFRFRFFLIFFCGLIAAGSIVYWRSRLLVSQEYVSFPEPKIQHHKLLLKAPAVQPPGLQKELNDAAGQN
jgi:hypothetical protein